MYKLSNVVSLGFDVFSKVDIPKNAFIVEYDGTLLPDEDFDQTDKGNFAFFFNHKKQQYW